MVCYKSMLTFWNSSIWQDQTPWRCSISFWRRYHITCNTMSYSMCLCFSRSRGGHIECLYLPLSPQKQYSEVEISDPSLSQTTLDAPLSDHQTQPAGEIGTTLGNNPQFWTSAFWTKKVDFCCFFLRWLWLRTLCHEGGRLLHTTTAAVPQLRECLVFRLKVWLLSVSVLESYFFFCLPFFCLR